MQLILWHYRVCYVQYGQGQYNILEAMLLSPQFLYRLELGQPVADRPGMRRLTDYEIASALSFARWGETPDDELLDAAEAHLPSDPVWLAERARIMLTDPRADAAIESFAAQWLRVPYIDTVPIARTVPGFDIVVRWDAAKQLRKLIHRYFAQDVNGDGLGDLIIGSPKHDIGNDFCDGGAAFVHLGLASPRTGRLARRLTV